MTVRSRFAPDFEPAPGRDPMDCLWRFLDDHLRNSGFDAHRRDGEIVLEQDWLLHQCWWAHDYVRQTPGIRRTCFRVNPRHSWDEFAPVVARFESSETSRERSEPVPLDRIVDVCREHLPFPSNFEAHHCEFKCGDISSLFKEAIWQEFGFEAEVTHGAVYDPATEKGWPHGFIVVPPEWTTDTDSPVILDGTAKQFCDEWHEQWPATLAPVDRIDDVHVVTETHSHRRKYALDRDGLELMG